MYELIRARYLAQFLPNHEYDRTQADFDCAGQATRAVGKRVVEPGWKRAMPEALAPAGNREAHAPQSLPALQQGQDYVVGEITLKDQQTQPPKPFTEGDLIKAMKNVAKLVDDPRLKQKLKDAPPASAPRRPAPGSSRACSTAAIWFARARRWRRHRRRSA